MAHIEEAIKAHLVASTAIDARISGRVYPSDQVPQGTIDSENRPLEFLTYREVGGEHAAHQGGSGTLERRRFIVSAFGPTAKAASELMELVTNLFNDFRGTVGSEDATVFANFCSMEEPRADVQPAYAGMEGNIFRRAKQLMIWFTVAQATHT